MLPTEKLEQLVRRFGELEELLCSPEVLGDRTRLTRLNKERSDLEPLVAAFSLYRDVERKIRDDEDALGDPDLRALAEAELPARAADRGRPEQPPQLPLPPPDPTRQN